LRNAGGGRLQTQRHARNVHAACGSAMVVAAESRNARLWGGRKGGKTYAMSAARQAVEHAVTDVVVAQAQICTALTCSPRNNDTPYVTHYPRMPVHANSDGDIPDVNALAPGLTSATVCRSPRFVKRQGSVGAFACCRVTCSPAHTTLPPHRFRHAAATACCRSA